MNKAFPLEPIEKASVDELRALQLKRLKASLTHAYDNSPVYRAKFDAAGVHPQDCQSLLDLAKFPFTTKNHLRDQYPFGLFAVPRGQVQMLDEHGVHKVGAVPQRHRNETVQSASFHSLEATSMQSSPMPALLKT
jgi:phenylacetate-coenzyme A ligase PaaK-like adenylate-forming protein